MKKSQILLVVCVVMAGTILGCLWLILRPHHDPELVRLAKLNHYDVDDYVYSRDVLKKVSAGEPVTMEEWQKVKEFIQGTNSNFRALNAGYLKFANDTEFEDQAIQLSHDLLDDPDPYIRAMALLNLYKLGAPGWQDIIQANLQSDVEPMRNTAARIWYKYQSEQSGR